MRRALLALTASGLLLLSTACNTEAAPPAIAKSTPVAVAPSGSASALSPAGAKACKKLMAAIEAAMPKFGDELGRILAAKAQKHEAQAKQARDEARKHLQELATQIRDITATADPALRTAAFEAAAKVERSAKDAEFFNRLETLSEKQSGTLEKEATDWTQPVITICV